MSRRYEYLFTDILSNRVVNELPCYGTSFNRELSGTGNMTATIPLNVAGRSNRDSINSTIPGKHALYAVCDDVVIWGGPIWSRTYSPQVSGLSLTGQTFESWPYKFFPPGDLKYIGMDQRNIARALFLSLASDPRCDAKFILPDEYSNSVVRTEVFPLSEVRSYGDLIEYMTQYSDGFDYEIECVLDSNGELQREVKFGYPQLGKTQEDSGLVFEYPGTIQNYYYSENASSSALRMHGVGAGDGAAMLRVTADQQDLIDFGTYPLLQQVYTNKDVSVRNTLISQTQQAGKAARTPRVTWSIEVDPTLEPVLGTWSLGDTMWVSITDDARFPDGPVEHPVRVIGWELTPPSSENKESLRLVLEGDDGQQ